MVKKFVIVFSIVASVLLFFISCGRNSGGSGSRGRDRVTAGTPAEGGAGDAATGAASDGGAVTEGRAHSGAATGPVAYSIYVENSASMDGYVSKPGSDFKNNLHSLIKDLWTKQIADTINLNYVNDIVCPFKHNAGPEDVTAFMATLTPDGLKHTHCERTNSFLHEIIDRVISTRPNDVDILVSDYIFSTGKGPSTEMLNQQRDKVEGVLFKELKKRDFSTIILKFNSGFDGTYYVESRGGGNGSAVSTTGKGIRRPYYVMIFGNQAKMRRLIAWLKTSGFNGYSGYEGIYSLYQEAARPPAAKLIRTHRLGDFRIEEPATRLVMNNAKEDDSATFQFALAMNLDSLPLDEKYLMDPANYELPGNYQLVGIEKNTDPTNTSLQNFTHTFLIRTADLKPRQDVSIRLRSRMPQWVEASSIINDDDPADADQQKKTFGFKYLVDGIKSSYEDKYRNTDQFNVNVRISTTGGGGNESDRSTHSGLPWIILVVVGVFIAVIIWIKNKR